MSISSYFKGRDEFMAKLRESFERESRGTAASVVAPMPNAVYGLGGVGKTRLAIEYAWQYEKTYSGLFFVVADTVANLQRNLAALAIGDVLDLPDQDQPDDDVKSNAVLRWLQGNSGWLLIIDNVDTEVVAAEVQRLLPKLRTGHVLITSRLRKWGADVQRLYLGVLSEDAAHLFLLERTAHDRLEEADDDAQALRLARELGQLALALEQAAAYINENCLSLKEYLATWHGNRAEVSKWFDERVMNYPRSVAITWQTSVDQLGEPARTLLQRLAWLAPEAIPNTLLTVSADGELELDKRRALAELDTYSLVTRDRNSPTFSLHRLVQDVTRQNLRSTNCAHERLGEAVNWLDAGFKVSSGPLIPHVLSALAFVQSAEFYDSDAGESLDRLAQMAVMALGVEGAERKHAFVPEDLAAVLCEFYEVQRLSAPIELLLRDHRAAWPTLQLQLLGVNNYVLRYAMAGGLADACTAETPTMRVEEIVTLLDETRTPNEFELGGYALGLIYARQPELIEPAELRKLAARRAYPGRKILGDLFLNLVFRADFDHSRNLRALLDSERFWDPIWDVISLDVCAIEAAEAFMAQPRRPLAPTALTQTRESYAALLWIESGKQKALESPTTGPCTRHLLERYFSLGQDSDSVELAQTEMAGRSQADLRELLRLFFAHPVWAVGEAAASMFHSLVREDDRRLAIVRDLFEDAHWRVRYSANEAAFSLRHRDKDLFFESVRRFHDDPVCMIRGLCAENLTSMILNSGRAGKALTEQFEKEIRYWLKDEDCWVLEHMYRLFNRLDQRGVKFDGILDTGVSRLFADAPQWYRLEREAFLCHIEERKEKLVCAAAA